MKHLLKLLLPWPLLFLVTCVAGLCVSCASNSVNTVEVYPKNSDGAEYVTHGFLVVDTPTELHFDEHSVRRYPHTGYSVYDAHSHHLVTYVHNRAGQAGEVAATVLLPAGNYLVEAQTASHRPIRFPVVIRPQAQTTVVLDSDVAPPKAAQGEFYAIQYHGRPIGWISEARAQ